MQPLPRPQADRRIDWAFTAVVLTAGVTALLPFFAGAAKLAYFQDDFFYYLQVARNLAEHGRSTFDGSTLTNGYHPLWLLVLAAAWLPGYGKLLFPIVALIIVAGTIFTYRLAHLLLRRCGVDGPAAAFAATWTALFYLSMARTGMEIILTVPLGLAFFAYVLDGSYLEQPRRIAQAGLLASVLVLSRLDSMLLLLLYAAMLLLQGPFLARRRQFVRFAQGMTPLWVYLVSNIVFFGTLDPISSQAKHLERGLHPDGTALHSLFSPFGLVAAAFLLPALALLMIGGVALIRRRKAFSAATIALLASALAFPVLYFGMLSLISDWRVWPWYRYPFVLSSVAAMLALRWTTPAKQFAQKSTAPAMRFGLLAASLALCVGFGAGLRKLPQNTDIYEIALRLQQFARQHPGRYAMGDAAGTPAFLIGQPVVQLEGLMMDKRFLENIREQKNLLDVLHAYNIRYYVALDAEERNGCRTVTEPRQAGRHSPHMTATICQTPAEQFDLGEYSVSVFDLDTKAPRQ